MIPEVKDLPYMERLRRLNLWTLEERQISCRSNRSSQNDK